MQRKQIIIIGGGFAGLRLATDLDDRLFDVTLIDNNNYHQFQPLIYQVSSSGLEASSICFPFRKIFSKRKNITFRFAKVLSVNPINNSVETNIGNMTYDFLVIATGTTTNFFGNETFSKNFLPMKSVEEAMLVRNKILLQLEKASITSDRQLREKLLNIVIVGGGATGVEVAGILSEMQHYVIPKDYHELNSHNLCIYLIEASPRLLGAMSEKSSLSAYDFLKSMGVEIMLNTRVVDYENEVVKMNNGTTIPSSLVIWVSGVTANVINGIPPQSIGKGGRIITNNTLTVKGFNDIYAIGDVAFIEGDTNYPNGHPQVAQVAIQQAKLLAKNLNTLSTGQTVLPFTYRNMGSLATIGRNKAVADLPGIHFNGFTAWFVWLVIHLRSILGVKNKIFVLLDWMWNYFSYNRSIRMIIFRGKRE